MLEDDRETKGELSSRPNAQRKTSDEEPISPEILSLIAGISGPTTPSKSSRQRSMTDKVKGKNKKRHDDDDDSDAASSVVSLDELITEPNASGASLNATYTGSSASHTEPEGSSSTAQRRQNSSSGVSSSSRSLPSIPTVSTSINQPQPPESVASPSGTQSVFSPVDTPVNPRFNPNYFAPTSKNSQLFRDMSRPGDLVFGPSQGEPAGSQNVNNSNKPFTKNLEQDNTNPFMDPPTPAYPNIPSTSNAWTPDPLTSTAFQQKIRTPEPQRAPIQNLNGNTQFSSRPRATKKLTEEDLNARLDEEDDEPIGSTHSHPPTTRHTPIPNATPSTNNNASRTNSANTRSSPSRHQSRIVDHGNRLTILPEGFDDYDFTINPDTRDNDAERGIYNPYTMNRQATPPWERRGSGYGVASNSQTDLDYDNVPPSLIDYDAALRIYDPQPQPRQQTRPQTPLQSSANPVRSCTPVGTRPYTVDDDRLFAIQLAEEQKGMIMNQAVAMYLDRTLTPLDDCSFDNLVAHGLVDREVLELIEQLDTTALEAVAVISSVPPPAPDSPLPTKRTDSPLGIPLPDPGNGKGKNTQADDDDATSNPLFSTNINRSDSTAQPFSAGSQSSINVFIQAPVAISAQKSPSPKPPAVTSHCGICFETFQVVDAPREAANLAIYASNAGKGKAVATVTDSSVTSEYGVILTCSKRHGFCIDCLTQYIKSKLQDGIPLEGKGFPVRCPGCDFKNSRWEADDELAESVLDEETLEFWRRQKLLLSLPGMIYCPNSRCSELLAPPEDLAPDMPTAAECPSCTCSLCFQCGSLWHPDLTCKENEAFKEHEDKEIYIMSKKQHWRRCPKCKMVVEKTEGTIQLVHYSH
ncbi:hypothetical protein M407DRAFT_32204 [Tulasnella calospora MUT 4182]|uniref:RBR-type E3 ubiquitin transferase n=1 Tax=Tulasnella calospora MUT 4182 TaxID=1051891 RepID=A0A0C3PTL5_9AGAM|nr:hypothetical protein M407DRAFT_32204 [Tulasnella calospora MUT 4182]